MRHRYEPDGAYSWRRLILSLAIATLGGVGLWSTPVVLPAIQEAFAVDRAGASLPYTATMVGFALGGIALGRLADRVGVFPPVLLGSLALAIGYLLAAAAPSYTAFVLIQAIPIGMLGSAATFAPLVADVSHWFLRRRGIAVAIVASGNYLAGTIWPPLLELLVRTQGWRVAHAVVGLVLLALMLPLALFLRPRPPIAAGTLAQPSAALVGESRLSPGTLQATLVLAGIACCIAMAMPQVHIVAWCTDLGYGPARGAEMLALMLGFGVVSRLASGLLADRFGGLSTLILGSALQTAALALYLPFDGLVPLYLVSALFGLAQGGIVPSYALVVRDHFPAREAGARVSLVSMATIVGMAVGGWAAGALYDATRSHAPALLHGIAWNLVNLALALLVLVARRPAPARQRALAGADRPRVLADRP